MKKILITTMAAVGIAASSFAQGTVNFASGTQVVTWEQTPGSFVSAALAANVQVQLFWAPVGTADLGLFQAVGDAVTVGNAAPAGRFVGGVRTVPAGTGELGIAPGANAAFIVRGWVGANWDQATHRGVSGILLIDTGDPTSTPAGTPTALTTGSPGFSGLAVAIVPEPSSMALAGLGAASLLIFRRRK